MSDRFLDSLLGRIAEAGDASMRLGNVTVIDAADGSLTVDMAGAVVTGVRWVGSYAPVEGDLVVVSRVGAMWVVLGKLSKQLGAPTTDWSEVVVLPAQARQVTYDGGASWQWSTPGGQSGTYLWQGSIAGEAHWGLVWYPSLAAMVPDGATILSARLLFTRAADDGGESPAFPEFYLHDDIVWPDGPGGSPVLGANWSPGSVLAGGGASWELPSAWLTDLLSGASTGIAIYSDQIRGRMRTGGPAGDPMALRVSYSIPT